MDQKVTLLTWEYQIQGHMHRCEYSLLPWLGVNSIYSISDSALALLLYDYGVYLNEPWRTELLTAVKKVLTLNEEVSFGVCLVEPAAKPVFTARIILGMTL